MIRYAQLKDINRINELGETLHNNFAKLFKVKEMLEDELAKVLVYTINDYVVGFIIATCLYENVDILSIVVDKNYRKKKIATNLIDFLFTEINETVELITLEVSVDNVKAINLYKKFGFEVVNIRKKYYNGTDAYLMSREVRK